MKIIDKICVGFYKVANWIGYILIIVLEYAFALIGIVLLLVMPYVILTIWGVSSRGAVMFTIALYLVLLLIFALVKIYQHGESVDLGLNNLEDSESFKELPKAFSDLAITIERGDAEDEE